jgi:putative N-acetyltransferase (TIGR04045 family)
MLFEPFRPFMPAGYQVKFVTEAWERRGAAALRRDVFCKEQGIFESEDRDAIDDIAIPIVAVSLLGIAPGEVAGTVRIHEASPGIWWGSRLAVAMPYRRAGALGASLIRLAVGSAHARGATEFYAHVQARNVPLFQRLQWNKLEDIELHGHPHALMRADLAAYPPIAEAETGFMALARNAA